MEVKLSKQIKNFYKVLFVLLNIFTKDQNIIQVNQNTLVQQLKKDIIHCPLEGGRGVTQSKGHYYKFKAAKLGAKGSFKTIILTHWQLVVTIPKI